MPVLASGLTALLGELINDPAVRSGEPADAFRSLAKALAHSSGIDCVGFWLVNEQQDGFDFAEVYSAESQAHETPSYAHKAEILPVIARVGGRQLVAINDTSQQSQSDLNSTVLFAASIASVMHAPIQMGGDVTGFISLANVHRQIAWTEDHKLLATTVASLAATVVERHRRAAAERQAAETAARLAQQQQILNEIVASATFREGTLEEAIATVGKAAIRLAKVDRFCIYRHESRAAMLVPLDLQDRRPGYGKRISAVPVSFFASDGEMNSFVHPVAYTDMFNDPRLPHARHLYSQSLDLRSGIDVPIVAGDRVNGVLCVRASGAHHEWTQDEISFAIALASLATLAFERHERHKAQNDLLLANVAIAAANDAKARYLSSMSYEIRTPVRGIRGMIDLLARSELDENQRRAAGIIKDTSETLLARIDDILDLARIEDGKRLDLPPATARLQPAPSLKRAAGRS